MILIVDLCYEKSSLSRYEFVNPIADIVSRTGNRYEILHYTEIAEGVPERYGRIILCGTALKDDGYAKGIEQFSWIKEIDRPILGICAGMQVIGSAFGGDVVPQPAIGLDNIEIVKETHLLGEPRSIEGYHLHNHGVTLPEGFHLVAKTPDRVEAFVHRGKPIYGITFHPEVRNRWIVERFVSL